MRGRLAAAILILGAITFMAGSVSWAAKPHAIEALDHTDAGIMHGKMGHADALVFHIEKALKHAEAAQVENASPELAEAIKSLKKSLQYGKAGDASNGTNAAEEALEHIKGIK